MKRSSTQTTISNKRQRANLTSGIERKITEEFLEDAHQEFQTDPVNRIARNAINATGCYNSTLDSEKANKVSHIFLNSLKPEQVKATNQENSGRCWMFAGLNVYRYMLINALGLNNFEFSETYLFFYDKLERANYIIQYFIDNPNAVVDDRTTSMLLKEYYTDGGYWNYFDNLVNKYGLVPKDVMNETFHSGWTSDMNTMLRERILSCCNQINKLNNGNNAHKINQIKKKAMTQIYHCLVKFLGEPPVKFDWYFKNSNKESHCLTDLTPHKFYDMLRENINTKDFVNVVNIPGKEYNKLYQIRMCTNMVDTEDMTFINLSTEDLKKYAVKSITQGIPVWFAGDVGKGFSYHKSVLDEGMYDTKSLLGNTNNWNKAEKIQFGYTEGNHAMTLTGVNLDHWNKPINWQVENSWGYMDDEEPGLDGFLTMSDQWFSDNLMQVAIHTKFLSRVHTKLLSEKPIQVEPWDFMAPALRVKNFRKEDLCKKV